jgi:hypothetical protein
MPSYVIDTSVCCVANNRNDEHEDKPDCVRACREKMRECVDILRGQSEGTVCIDEGGHIINEYKNELHWSGRPGEGDRFFFELFRQQYSDNCERVDIHENSVRGFKEFPDDPALANFDHDDRKFVAVALTSRYDPSLVNATDSDYLHFQTVLEKHGVRVEQLCPDCLKEGDA